MKLIIAITRDEESENIIQSLIEQDYRVTQIASTGGFLRRGMTTMMIGVEDEKVEKAIQVMKDKCTPVADPGLRCTTLFVLDVDRYTQV